MKLISSPSSDQYYFDTANNKIYFFVPGYSKDTLEINFVETDHRNDYNLIEIKPKSEEKEGDPWLDGNVKHFVRITGDSDTPFRPPISGKYRLSKKMKVVSANLENGMLEVKLERVDLPVKPKKQEIIIE